LGLGEGGGTNDAGFHHASPGKRVKIVDRMKEKLEEESIDVKSHLLRDKDPLKRFTFKFRKKGTSCNYKKTTYEKRRRGGQGRP